MKLIDGTDIRLIGTKPYVLDVKGETHAHIKGMLRTDMAEFLKHPTNEMLSCVTSLLLSYQDSFLAGVGRKP